MADLSKYQAYNDALKLCNAAMKSHSHFKREFKYTLGDEIVKKSLALVDCVVRGLDGFDRDRKRRNILEAINLTTEIESRILLAADNNCMDNVHAGWYLDHIPQLRRQLEGLSNSLARRSDTGKPVSENL